MGYKLVCDLCGKPLDCKSRIFKVKELKRVRTEAGIFGKWQTIDIHTDCLKKLLEAKREANTKKGGLDGHTD